MKIKRLRLINSNHAWGREGLIQIYWLYEKALKGRLCVNCEVSNKHFIPGYVVLLLSSFTSRDLTFLPIFFFPSAFDCGSSGAQCCSLCSKGSFQLHIVMAGADVDCFDLQQVQGRTPYLGWCCRHSINALGRQQQLKATSLHAFGCQRMCLSWDRLRCPAATIPPVSCVYSSKGVCVFTSALPGPGCWL